MKENCSHEDDWEEFNPIKGVKQIFGHTNRPYVRIMDDNYCIDTAGKNYIVIEDDKAEVKIV